MTDWTKRCALSNTHLADHDRAREPLLSAGRNLFTYSGATVTAIPNGTQPNLLNTSYTITADIQVPDGSADGMLVVWAGGLADMGYF
jgi:arylsulfatase